MYRLLVRRLSTSAGTADKRFSAASRVPNRSSPLQRGLPKELYPRILAVWNPQLPLAPVLEQWTSEGHTVEKTVIQSAIKKLMSLNRLTHALELSYWMTDRRHLYLSAGDVAYRLQLIAKVHGLEKAVEYFGNVSQNLKKPQCYGSLLKCHVDAKAVEKAEELFAEMQEMGMKTA